MTNDEKLCKLEEDIRELKHEFSKLQDEIFTLKSNSNITQSTEKIVVEHLFSIGVPANIQGFRYLKKAILMTIHDQKNMSKNLYQRIAQTYNSTPLRVEKSIRDAISIAWRQVSPEVMKQMFGNTASVEKKPTNSEFIALIAERTRLKI